MAVIRIPEHVHLRTHAHLFGTPGEHFAFLRARVACSADEPVFLVYDVRLVPDEAVTVDDFGYELDPDCLLGIVNEAVLSGDALIEAHNHGGSLPRPSRLDLEQLAEFVPYILDSLPGRPYAATVWAAAAIYGAYYLPDQEAATVRSITVAGSRLRQLVSRDDDLAATPTRFDRQLSWLSAEGQRQLGRLRVGVVGAGGTGSPTLIELAYLGLRDFVIVDPDRIDETSLNRTTTATPADIGTAKVVAARRSIRSIASEATVRAIERDLRHPEGLEALKGVDVLFGCVDNDGARLVLNELARAYNIPYFDLGVGIEVNRGEVTEIGGRVAFVGPEAPCLLCMDLIDREEARYVLSSRREQEEQRRLGYVRGLDVPAPSVVSLNGTLSSLAVTEFAVYTSGARPVSPLTVLDVLGKGRAPAQWVVPELVSRRPACLLCGQPGLGDATSIERYAA